MERAFHDFGWKVVAAVFTIAALTWGVGLYGITTLLATLKVSHGWSTAILSGAVSLHYLTSAILVLYLVRAHGLFGIARVTQAGAAFMAAGIMIWAHASAPWHLVFGALLTGAGWAATGTTAITAMISGWFGKDRPKALGSAMNGISVGGLLFAPAWPYVIDRLGASTASIVVGLTACLTIWVLASIFLTPAGPYSVKRSWPARTQLSPSRIVLPTWKFQSVAIAFGVSIVAAMGVLIHLPSHLAATWGPVPTGLAIALVAGSTVAGRLVLGWWLHKLGFRVAAALCFLAGAAGAALLTATIVPSVVLTGCVLFGLGGAGLNLLPPLIAHSEYQADITPAVTGFFGSTAQVAITVAPLAMGCLSDMFGTYQGPFLIAALLLASASLLVLSHRGETQCIEAG